MVKRQRSLSQPSQRLLQTVRPSKHPNVECEPSPRGLILARECELMLVTELAVSAKGPIEA